ncbi:DUF4041 domain-containing protein [Klebsiella pneumoniae]|uniref:DUF4041 domain-containing protein n=1 Tax=Klebsiella pneumoniae TaxID=573 RepID=UPI003C12FFA0
MDGSGLKGRRGIKSQRERFNPTARAFNSECDAAIANVTFKNINTINCAFTKLLMY